LNITPDNFKKVVAIVSTYRRPMELERLFKSLLHGTQPPFAAVVNDDSADAATAKVVRELGIPHEFLVREPAPTNTAASGWNRALDVAVNKFGDQATHYLIIDDDAKVAGDTLALLLAGQQKTGAMSSFPAAYDPEDNFYITAQLVEGRHEDAQKCCKTREDLQGEFQDETPRAWMFQGLCHLMRRDVVHSGIRFDERFWMCGEDLDFSVRVAEKWGSVFVPQASCWHLYGAPFNPRSAKNSAYLKKLSLIQNMTYVGYWRPYGRRIRGRYLDFLRGRGLGKTYARFLRDYGTNRHTVYDLLWVIFCGMFLRQPSNDWSGRKLRLRRRDFLVDNT
jgi:GT2 family glycosyltransferase